MLIWQIVHCVGRSMIIGSNKVHKTILPLVTELWTRSGTIDLKHIIIK